MDESQNLENIVPAYNVQGRVPGEGKEGTGRAPGASQNHGNSGRPKSRRFLVQICAFHINFGPDRPNGLPGGPRRGPRRGPRGSGSSPDGLD